MDPDSVIPVYEQYNKTDKVTKDILVLSGGAIKGVAHVGVVKALEIRGYLKNIKHVVGTSAGALVGAILVAGYTPDELFCIIKELNLGKIQNINYINYAYHLGCDDGKKVRYAFSKLMKTKGHNPKLTFKELYNKTGIKLTLTTTRVRPFKEYFLSYETYPDMPVVDGVMMSISIPFLFIPMQNFGGICIDGSLPNIYPIYLFRHELDRVIGVCLLSDQDPESDNSRTEFLKDITYCITEGIKSIMIKLYSECTIQINIKTKGTFNFDIDAKTADEYFNEGFISTIKFIDKLENKT